MDNNNIFVRLGRSVRFTKSRHIKPIPNISVCPKFSCNAPNQFCVVGTIHPIRARPWTVCAAFLPDMALFPIYRINNLRQQVIRDVGQSNTRFGFGFNLAG